MKSYKYCLSFCLLLLFSTAIYGQIQINSSGNIGMGSYDPINTYTVRGESSYYDTSNATYSYVYNSMGIGPDTNGFGHEATLFVKPAANVAASVVYITDYANRASRELYVNGSAASTQGWYTISDRKTKKNQRGIDKQSLLEKLTKIRAKAYEYKSRKELLAMHNAGEAHFEVDTIFKVKEYTDKNGRTTKLQTTNIEDIVVDLPNFKKGETYGVIAQEVLEVYPELVSMDESSGLYAVDYQGFVPLLLEGFNIQQEEILEMREEIKQLKNLINEMRNSKGN